MAIAKSDLAVLADIFTTLIGEIAHCFEAEHHNFFIERVELAHRGDVDQRVPEQVEVALEGALRGDELTELVGKLGVRDVEIFQPVTEGFK
jgi:hypothetical protein